MKKLTPEEKLVIVHRYFNEPVSYRELEKITGIDNSTLRYWVKLYEYHGCQAFNHPYTNYPPAFKLEVVQCIEDRNYSIREAAALFHIPHFSMARRWLNKWREGGPLALEDQGKGTSIMPKKKKPAKDPSLAHLDPETREELERLRMENAYLKKLFSLSSKGHRISQKQKAQVIYELRPTFSVNALAEIAQIPRSTYYDIIAKRKRLDPDRKWKRRIRVIYKAHDKRYGYRRISDTLNAKGYKINHKKVLRLMQEMGIKSLVSPKQYKSYKGKVGETADNHLNREFTADKPNQKWVTDITEIKILGEKLYLSPILDLYNGEIVAYNVASRQLFSLVEGMLDKALPLLQPEDQLLLHSDQGWHYQMKPYQETLKEHNVTQSMSRKGNCHDNSVMENFFGIMKKELLYYKDFTSVAHFKQELDEYIDYYNNERMKARLKTSPVLYRKKLEEAA
ncbi:IS3 family transposase [Halobacillus sp. A1]|uniref:IS3 family transposase n=1 Tax=Halobacillus sp. A1 TaxID=2880262 RepID=UPI0020A6BBFF|nr:IS3 family transposase [Halobacillus sp. A1]MCP3033606.1 IS3 family transposase [Halobacillus sp. A1]